jgi:hypothetical protein
MVAQMDVAQERGKHKSMRVLQAMGRAAEQWADKNQHALHGVRLCVRLLSARSCTRRTSA